MRPDGAPTPYTRIAATDWRSSLYLDKYRLEGKKGFITGGARGIGPSVTDVCGRADPLPARFRSLNVWEPNARICDIGEGVLVTVKTSPDARVLVGDHIRLAIGTHAPLLFDVDGRAVRRNT